MRALLTIETGQGEPRVCSLYAECRVTLGRHRNNLIVLHDEHASRWHAEVFLENGRWFIRDFGALNGTRVNGETVAQQVALAHGHLINIGKTGLRFTLETASNGGAATPNLEDQSLATADLERLELDQTVLCRDELTTLCQFMTYAVKENDPQALIQTALEHLQNQTTATVAGYLSLDPEEPLPKIVLPKLSRVDIHLSRRLTQEVQRRNQTVWLGAQPNTLDDTESLQCFKDALCLPLRAGEVPLGALHVYRTGKSFTQREVRFCEILTGHLANCLHLLRAHRTLSAENSRLRRHVPEADQLIGNSPALQQLRQRIGRLAPLPSTILVVGETGSGKELVALALHKQSSRRDGPLVSANCAAIAASSLLESELFGHCKGAFSGAERDYPGIFRLADEGTLFLDEVGELPLDCQAKLLRVIEGKPFRPVGATAEVVADVRLIAATNRALEQEVKAGRFREDLFFRMQGLQIRVPPLREHKEDLRDLVDFFLRQLASEWGRQAKVSEAGLHRLEEYSWPGNVRQLRLALENAVASCENNLLEPADFLLAANPSSTQPPSLNLEELEKWAIRQALRRTEGNISQAVRELGIVRDTLANKMKKYEISKDENEA